MQGDRGLAGAGAAGDDEGAVVGGAHGGVLLGLDRGDDVAHVAGALAADGGQEGAVADDDRAGQPVDAGGVEQLVVEADDRGAAAADRAPPDDAERGGRRRPVERGGGRGAPVDDDRLLLLGAQPEPAQVQDLPVGVVEAPEHEPLAGEVEVGAAGRGGQRLHVALVQRLRGLALVGRLRLALASEGDRAQLLEPGVGARDVLLLARDLRGERRVLDQGVAPRAWSRRH